MNLKRKYFILLCEQIKKIKILKKRHLINNFSPNKKFKFESYTAYLLDIY